MTNQSSKSHHSMTDPTNLSHGDTPKPPGVSETASTDLSQLREQAREMLLSLPNNDAGFFILPDSIEPVVKLAQSYADREIEQFAKKMGDIVEQMLYHRERSNRE